MADLRKKVPSYADSVWDDAEAKRFVKTALGEKDGLLYVLSLVAGLRIKEVANLTWSDINLEDKILVIKGSYKKVRSLPLSQLTVEALEDYKKNKNLIVNKI